MLRQDWYPIIFLLPLKNHFLILVKLSTTHFKFHHTNWYWWFHPYQITYFKIPSFQLTMFIYYIQSVALFFYFFTGDMSSYTVIWSGVDVCFADGRVEITKFVYYYCMCGLGENWWNRWWCWLLVIITSMVMIKPIQVVNKFQLIDFVKPSISTQSTTPFIEEYLIVLPQVTSINKMFVCSIM